MSEERDELLRATLLDSLRFISEASSIVGDCSDADEALRRLAELSVPRFADVAFVYLLDEEGRLRRQYATAADPGRKDDIEAMWRRFAPTSAIVRPVLEAAAPQLRARLDDSDYDFIENVQQREALKALGIHSAISIPMRTSGHTFGVIVFGLTREGRSYDSFDLLVAEEIANRAATAIEKARMFEAERRAREEAERASRGKDEFLAVLSHELRTPMTTVIGWADFLKMTHGDDPELAGPIDSLRTSARVQAKLVDDLLDVSRIITGKLSVRKADMELVGVVRAAVEAMTLTAQTKNVPIALTAPGEAIPMSGDATRLQQAVTNLLANAVKFTPSGGHIDVTVSRQANEARIVVQDTGEGIDPDFLPHVFDRFRQASSGDSRRYSGLGLGLSIVQHVVQLHGGTVRAESEGPGKGARFVVTLPIREE